MTAVLGRHGQRVRPEVQQPMVMPVGWGIAANLAPPELIASHRIRRLRERFVLALVAVALLAAGGYGFGMLREHEAGGELSAEQARTVALRQQQARFAALVSLQDKVVKIRANVGTLLADDVELGPVIEAIERARPAGVELTDLTVTLDAGTAPGASGAKVGANAAPGQLSLDTSGAKRIGSIELHGTGTRIDDAAAFVTALKALPGVTDVFPTDNRAGGDGSGTDFTITVTLTEALQSHRFDTSAGR